MDIQVSPWSSFAPASIAFCEARLSGWLAEPSNAISNLAYVLPAVWVARQKAQATAVRLVECFAALTLALTSFLFHASGTRLFEVADVSSMYLLPSLSVAVALSDAGRKGIALLAPFLTWGGATALMALTGSNGIVAWGVLAAVSIALEVRRAQVLPAAERFTDLRKVVGFFLGAYAVWWTDKLGWLCAPDNHVLTGHAVWHCGTAAAIFFFYRHHLRVAQAQARAPQAAAGLRASPTAA